MLQFGVFEVRKTERFDKWLRGIKDHQARGRILSRLARLEDGHKGDTKNVGPRVWEIRIHFGPGLRLYFTRIGARIIVLLAGGDKSTQAGDIETARAMAAHLDLGKER